MGYTVASITPRIATRLNDPAQTSYTDPVLLPYIQDAADELQLELELNGSLVLEEISAAIIVPIWTGGPGTEQNLGALLPVDMLEPQRLEERLSGSPDMFVPLIRRQWGPDILPTDSLRFWSYREQDIFFVGATTVRDVKIYYLRRDIMILNTGSTIDVNNSQLFMINKSAALAARYIGENPTRATELDNEAAKHLNSVTRIGVKSKQGARTRRRPYVVAGRRRWV